MKLGVDYYPEQWPEDRWATDAKMMAELGLTYVRLGEFAWSLLEPADGQFDFSWLERAIAILANENLKIIVGTPTATPPPWLTSQTDIVQRNVDGLPWSPGTRRHACANNPDYRRYSQRIVTELLQRIGDHPAVVGWQIDNEFGCHATGRCYCDHCRAAFQRWLQARYGSLDRLNRAWGTVFWSAVYTDWSQIPLPRTAPAQHNPSLQLDFRRFASDSWVEYQRMQIDLVRRWSSNRPITHNYLGSNEDTCEIDYFDLAADLDFVSWDNYPQGSDGPHHVALNHDMMRGFKQKPYWVMEQQPGVVNWHPYNRPVPPNLVRLWTYQGLGHGAEAVIYFRWRAARYGQEQYHAGLLRQDGSPTGSYREAAHFLRDLAAIPAISRRSAKVAILIDYADWWALQIDPHQHDFSYLKVVASIYQDLWAAGISADVIRRTDSIEAYKVVIVPGPNLIDEEQARRWQQFVEQGGRLLVTFRAFVKEQSNIWSDQPLPAGLDTLLGVQIEDYLGLPPDMRGAARNASGGLSFPYWRWAELLRPTTGQPLLFYNQFYWRDQVAATQNEVGQGIAVYVGCWFEHMLPQTIWEELGLDELALPFTLPNDVEAIAIDFADGAEGVLLLNHNAEPKSVHLHRPVVSLLLNLPPTTLITVQPRDVAVLRYQ
ncbi:MAG: beta-galactosidase [Anaerolineae bacterium]|nr:beta-galactosidase [Anaerolineae bacterium]